MHYFSRFSKNLTNHVLIFCAFGRKNNWQKMFEKFSKDFLKKIVKNALFLSDFQKHLTNHALIFCAFGRKRQVIEIFEKIFENFEIFSSENC